MPSTGSVAHTLAPSDPEPATHVRLTVDTGPGAGTHITLQRGQPTRIGSGPDCELRIEEPGVADQHAVVKALRDQGYGVKALATGLRVNGSEVEAAPLREGDVIEVGTTRISYGGAVQSAGLSIPGFRILSKLGTGGQGDVYLAEQVSLNREVALKVLSPKLTADPQFIETFVAEARAAAKLQHPNVVHVFDVGHHGDTYYYTMEVMSDGSLETWLRKNGRMPIERALQVVADAAAGLAYAESLRVVHRDIKPDNLMLDKHGTVKIADLGLARSADDSDEKLSGTPHFMAPEQILRKPVDHRTDLYALGSTFYRLVTGSTPFRGKTVKEILRAKIKDEHEPATKAEPSVPGEVSAIIDRLLQKEPDDRYQSASDLLADLEDLLTPPARKGLWLSLVGTAVVIATAAIWWALNKEGEKEIVELYRDNPEAQRLAVENGELKHQLRQDKATIALLQARLSGLAGLELAAALDRMAANHPETDAAAQAAEIAASTRSEVEAEQARRARLAASTAESLDKLHKNVQQALEQNKHAVALQLVDTAVTPDQIDVEAWQQGRSAERVRVIEAGAARIDALRTRIEQGREQQDIESVAQAVQDLQAIVAGETGWPAELIADRSLVTKAIEEARQVQTNLAEAAAVRLWQQYSALFAPEGSLRGAVRRLDYRAAEKIVGALAASADGSSPGTAAGQLQAALGHAGKFAETLAATLASQPVLLEQDEDRTEEWTGWDIATGQMTITTTPATRRPKPTTRQAPIGSLSTSQWQRVVEQIANAPPGSSQCFLAFAAVERHVEAAKDYLSSLSPSDDTSGTGDASYPLPADGFAALLAGLPADDGPWRVGIERELRAADALANGLRALSERRNLAAAGHIDRLLKQFGHSMVVESLRGTP